MNVQNPNYWTQREVPPPGHFKGPVDARLGVLPLSDLCVTLGKSLPGPCSVLLREVTGEVRFLKKGRKGRETLCKVLCTYEGLLFPKNIK